VIRVRVPAADWTALSEFVAAQRVRQLGIQPAVQGAESSGTDRIIAFESAEAVRLLIERINAYATTWDVRWAVSLNRVLPRLYGAISGPIE